MLKGAKVGLKKRYIFGVPLYFWEGCGFYTGCGLNYLSSIHLLKAAIIF